VVLAADEIVGHMRENFVIPAPGELPVIDRVKPTVPPEEYLPFNFDGDGVAPLAAYGSEYVFHVTTTMHGPNGFASVDPANAAKRVTHLHRKIENHRDEIVMTNSFDTEGCDVLIIAAGAMTRAARAAALRARKAGVKAGVLQLVTIWPFADKEIIAAAQHAKTVVVAEMNYSGQLAGEVRKLFGNSVKLQQVNSFNGEVMTPQAVLQAIPGVPSSFAAGAK
jgi:2-oxoglutarate ferredoxin oxidoreductase subunit alpha